MANLTQMVFGILGIASGARALARSLDESTPSRSRKAPAAPRPPLLRAAPPPGKVKGRGRGRFHVEVHHVRNIDERVSYIIRQLHKGRRSAEVREWAAKVLSQKCGGRWCVPEKDKRAEVIALFNATRARVRYTGDPYGIDLYQHPKRTLQFQIGDCDDYTATLGAALQSVGYAIRLRVIRTVDSKEWNHIYLLVEINGAWYPLDASVDRPAFWEAPARMIAAKRDYRVP